MVFKIFYSWFEKNILASKRPYLWIALVVSVVYFPMLFFGIVYLDDNVLVVRDYAFNRSLANLFPSFEEDIFRSPQGSGSFYRPILRWSFILDAQFGQGAIVFMSHFSNLLMHIGAMLLFFAMLFKFGIGKPGSFFLALLFAIHPLTAQTVSFIPGRNDSLLAVFIFLAIISFLGYLETSREKYRIWHFIFFLAALFTKETAVMVPVVLGAYLLIFEGPKKILGRLKPYLVFAVGWASCLVVWFAARRAVLGDFVGNADYSIVASIVRNFPVIIPTLGKVFLPFDLSVFPILQNMSFFWGFLALAILAAWFIVAKKRNYRLIAFGTAWFLLFFLLTLIKPEGPAADFSENRIYIPMLGFAFVIWGLGTTRFVKTTLDKKIVLASGALIILILASVTVYRNKYYKNSLSFWKNSVATSPDHAFNHNNLGAMFYLAGNLDEAEREFKIALELNPSEKMAHNNLGLIHAGRDEQLEAEQEYLKEMEINPNYQNAHYNLGLLYHKQGKIDQARQEWEMTLLIDPSYVDALYSLACLHYEQQEFTKAAKYVELLARMGVRLPPELEALLDPITFMKGR